MLIKIAFVVAFVFALVASEIVLNFGEAMSDNHDHPLDYRDHLLAAAVALLFALVVVGLMVLLATFLGWH